MARHGVDQTLDDKSDDPGPLDDLATHLLGLVRATIEAPARLRRRYRMRHYIP
jgi:hypothetical protein